MTMIKEASTIVIETRRRGGRRMLSRIFSFVNQNILNGIGLDLRRYYGTDLVYLGLDSFDERKDLLGDIFSILGKEVSTVIDVGAFRGDAIRLFRYTWPGTRIVAFEADPSSATILHNHWDSVPGVEIVGSAVLDITGTTMLYQFRSKSKSSILDMDIVSAASEPRLGSVQVPSISLSDYCSKEGLEEIDLLSIASCGSELQVIQGAEDLIDDKRINLIVVEMKFKSPYKGNVQPSEIFSMMESLGYAFYGIYNQISLGGALESADGLWRR